MNIVFCVFLVFFCIFCCNNLCTFINNVWRWSYYSKKKKKRGNEMKSFFVKKWNYKTLARYKENKWKRWWVFGGVGCWNLNYSLFSVECVAVRKVRGPKRSYITLRGHLLNEWVFLVFSVCKILLSMNKGRLKAKNIWLWVTSSHFLKWERVNKFHNFMERKNENQYSWHCGTICLKIKIKYFQMLL